MGGIIENVGSLTDEEFLAAMRGLDDTSSSDATGGDDTTDTGAGDGKAPEGDENKGGADAGADGGDTSGADGSTDGGAKDGAGSADGADDKGGAETPDYEAFYKQVLNQPIKAAGKTIEIRNAEEAVRLIQMGADYHRKTEELAANRKFIMMLEKNKLLDQDELSFLIDVKNGNPEAIAKLLKDSKVDPMAIDVDADTTYTGGTHTVSDQEANFSAALNEVATSEKGNETIATIKGWDQASRDVLWEHPEVMTAIHEHRISGAYDSVAGEVARRKTFGQIPQGEPFILAYQAVCKELADAQAKAAAQGGSGGNGGGNGSGGSTDSKADQHLGTREAQSGKSGANDDKAKAAGQTRGGGGAGKGGPVDVSKMNDEQFMEFMKKLR